MDMTIRVSDMQEYIELKTEFDRKLGHKRHESMYDKGLRYCRREKKWFSTIVYGNILYCPDCHYRLRVSAKTKQARRNRQIEDKTKTA